MRDLLDNLKGAPVEFQREAMKQLALVAKDYELWLEWGQPPIARWGIIKFALSEKIVPRPGFLVGEMIYVGTGRETAPPENLEVSFEKPSEVHALSEAA